MPWIDAFAPVTAHNRQQVMRATWGHLAPSKGRKYHGHIVFAIGCFGSDHLNPTVLECELKGLDSSPWFYDAVQEFLASQETEEGGVYRFDGYFRNYELVGSIRRLVLT